MRSCAATATRTTSQTGKPPPEPPVRLQAAAPREPEGDHDQEPGKLRGLFRRRS